MRVAETYKCYEDSEQKTEAGPKAAALPGPRAVSRVAGCVVAFPRIVLRGLNLMIVDHLLRVIRIRIILVAVVVLLSLRHHAHLRPDHCAVS